MTVWEGPVPVENVGVRSVPCGFKSGSPVPVQGPRLFVPPQNEGIKRSLRGVVMIESSSWQVCEREPTTAQFQVPSINLGYRVSFNTSGDMQVSTASFDRARQAPLSPGEVRGR